MKELFAAIDKGDIEKVKSIVSKKPETVNAVAPLTPKRNAYQSPLRVAIKNMQCEIVEYLIENGADINYRTPKDGDNMEWVLLHQAVYTTMYRNIRRMAFTGRILENGEKEYSLAGHKDRFDKGCHIIRLLLEAGADVNALDNRESENTLVLSQAGIDINSIDSDFGNWNSFLYAINYGVHHQERNLLNNNEPVLLENIHGDPCWEEDMRQILGLLISYGADTDFSYKKLPFLCERTGTQYVMRLMGIEK